MTALRLINAAAVRRLLPMAECIGLMKDAFRAEAEGRTAQPIRAMVRADHGRGTLAWMPGAITGPDWLGIKVLTIFPGNFGTALASHQGLMLLFDHADGRPTAIIDAREITAIRTAAATAAATDLLARPDARSLAIFGYGEQAETHLAAIRKVRAIDEALVWGRDPAKAHAFAERHGPGVRAAATPEEAAGADILCLTTAASEPYFEGCWLRPGQHVNAVGSSVATTSEVDPETVARARVYVDFAQSAEVLAGDLRLAREAGAIATDHVVGSVGDVITGRVPGRTAPDEITFFKSLGMVAEDLVAADHILRRAEAEGVGSVAEW
jgi:ornithine cyclodeaminase